MSGVFVDAIAFNQDIGSWNIENVQYLFSMFSGASSFNQDIGGWKLEKVMNAQGMFSQSGMNCENYSNTLAGWAAYPLTANFVDFTLQNNMTYNEIGAGARATLIAKGWTITNDARCFIPANPHLMSRTEKE
jgi:hypothetical protein